MLNGGVMMMDEKWLNISELKRETKIASATVERYLGRFAHLLRCEERGRGKFYHPETVAILQRAYSLSTEEKRDMQDIENIIRSEFGLAITIDTEQENTITPASSPTSLATKDDVVMMFKLLQAEIAAAREENGQLHEYIKIQLASSNSYDRQKRITDRITDRRVEVRLEEEAITLWDAKPEIERLKKIGWFRKEDDLAKRDIFVKQYVNEHFEHRLKEAYGLDDQV
jgi:hypothetical protein